MATTTKYYMLLAYESVIVEVKKRGNSWYMYQHAFYSNRRRWKLYMERGPIKLDREPEGTKLSKAEVDELIGSSRYPSANSGQ